MTSNGEEEQLSLNSLMLGLPKQTENILCLLPTKPNPAWIGSEEREGSTKKVARKKSAIERELEEAEGITLITMAERHEKEEQELVGYGGATKKDVHEFREIFSLVDTDHGGSIDVKELKKLTDLLNIDVSNEELDNMLREIDSTGTGEVNFVDFVKSMTKKPKVDYSIEEVQASFKLLAQKDDPAKREPGKISSATLAEQLMHVGLPGDQLSKDKVDEILAITEADSRGIINYDEFVQLMMGSKNQEES